MGTWRIVSLSAGQTMRWGRRLGALLQGGEIIGLTGELGTGKTCFVRGVAEGLRVASGTWIRSPTFTLINEYPARVPIYHIDLYRTGSRTEIEELNLREYLYAGGVSLIEWFERLSDRDADEYLTVHLAYADGNKRRLTFTSHGRRYERMIEGLKNHRVRRAKGSGS